MVTKYNIEVKRLVLQYKDFNIVAASVEEAEEIAMQKASEVIDND